MAEFCEVMKQAKRMCASHGNGCRSCALENVTGQCPLVCHSDELVPMDWSIDKLSEIECIVMDWAAAHPEPRYPSWNEGWQQLFPTVTEAPCLHDFGVECDGDCTRCREDEMRADIAEKLGVKPIGGDADA